MNFIVAFVLAVIKELGGPDLANLNLPGEVAKLVVEATMGNEKPLRDFLDNDAGEARRLYTLLTRKLSQGPGTSPTHTATTVIGEYLGILNPIAESIDRMGRDLLLGGFLHSKSCYSYWHLQGFREQPFQLRKHPNLELISVPSGLEIHLIDGEVDDEFLYAKNSEIRQSESSRLPSEFWSGAPQVETIKEFELRLEFGDSVKILPSHLEGIGEMYRSFPIALSAFGYPLQAVREAIAGGRAAVSGGSGAP